MPKNDKNIGIWGLDLGRVMQNQNTVKRFSPIRVLVVDDQKMMRALFKDYANTADDVEVVGVANDGKDGVERALELNPDVILMDIEMPRMDGIAATQMLRKRKSTAKVLVVSASYDDRYLAQALRKGAMGYLLKTTSPEDLVAAIRGVHSGRLQFGSGILQRKLSSMAPGATSDNSPALPTPRNGKHGLSSRPHSPQLAAMGDRPDSSSSIPKVKTSPTVSVHSPATSPPASHQSEERDLTAELSQIRAAYWVLKNELKTVRSWLDCLSILTATSFVIVLLILLFN